MSENLEEDETMESKSGGENSTSSGLRYSSMPLAGNSGFSFLDPSMLMPSAAAVAAVAAAAANQLAQGQSVPPSTGQHLSGIPMPFHGHQNSAPSSGPGEIPSNVSARIAALMTGSNGGGSSSLPMQSSHSKMPTYSQSGYATRGEQTGRASSIQAPFSSAAQVVAAQAAAAASSRAINNSLLPSMQNWPLEQLEQHSKLLQQMNQPIPQSVALLLADARRKEEKKTAKRVANRKSACTSRARKKALVEEMTRTNARLRRQALILSLLPDLVIVISVDRKITFCSAQVQRVLRYKIDDLIGAKIDEILIPASQIALGKLIDDFVNPGKEAQKAENGKPRKDVGHNTQNSGSRLKNKASGNGNGSAEASSGSNDASSGAAAVVSDQSFPLSVVKVKSKQGLNSVENENYDTSGSNEAKQQAVSSLTNSTSTVRSPPVSLGNSNSGSEDGVRGADLTKGMEKGAIEPQAVVAGESKDRRLCPTESKPSSDDSSTGWTATKKVRQANENLERNVRWHKQKLQSMSKSAKSKAGHKDDVTGASVTANNASARLSSLQHPREKDTIRIENKKYENSDHSSSEDSLLDGVEENAIAEDENAEQADHGKKKQSKVNGDHSSSEDSLLAGVEEKKKPMKNVNNENASDDSGYRESNDSREETSSCASDSSNSKGRNKPMAPTCNICLIRENLTTIWCEVTSSIRTRDISDDSEEGDSLVIQGLKVPTLKSDRTNSGKAKLVSTIRSDNVQGSDKDTVMELLLCLRPIRDGDEKIDESLRFVPHKRAGAEVDEMGSQEVSDAVVTGSSASDRNGSTDQVKTGGAAAATELNRPPKKRPLPARESLQMTDSSLGRPAQKRIRQSPHQNSSSETEKSVVESLMLMSNKSK